MGSKEISEQQNKLLYEGERERKRIDALTIVTLEKYNHNVHINTCITNQERERGMMNIFLFLSYPLRHSWVVDVIQETL